MSNFFKNWTPASVEAHNRRISSLRASGAAGSLASSDIASQNTENPTKSMVKASKSPNYDHKSGQTKRACGQIRKPSRNGYNPDVVLAYFKEMGIPTPKFEYQFNPARKWRFDICWPDAWQGKWGGENHDLMPLALEVQGGIFSYGGHNRGAAMLKEWEKLNDAACRGWRIIYCQPTELCMQETINTIKRALGIP